VKTGRLLKFQRPGGRIHAYFYLDQGVAKAALYVLTGNPRADQEPAVELEAPSGESLDREVRAWVDAHFPKA
jgi:hypothetical protein